MKQDVLELAAGRKPAKGPSKETLNHPDLIRLASGIDPYADTLRAYLAAYQALGIDLVNRVPEANAPPPPEPGTTRDLGNGYVLSPLGVYGTASRVRYPFEDVEEFFRAGGIHLDYHQLVTPVPHRLDLEVIRRKDELLGDAGVYYYQLYTTLFMWGVEALGWEVFMLAAALDPQGFDERFLQPAFEASLALTATLCDAESPLVFFHDDLADARGPVFAPDWYERYIFPRYPELFAPVHAAGKKVIFVADGNMEAFLEPLRNTGVDGVMLENPATSFEAVIRAFGDRIVIGGVETRRLSFDPPEAVRAHVLEVHARTRELPGFVMSTPGGIHGSIPLANLEAYFDARVETGHTPPGWRCEGRGDTGARPNGGAR